MIEVMKVTKYPQSCLKIEKSGCALIIDPGEYFRQKFPFAALGGFEAVLYTHEHEDHFDKTLLSEIRNVGAEIYANQAVANLVGRAVNVVKAGDKFKVAEFEISVVELAHFPPATEVPNVGYVVDGTLFHPGDSIDDGRVRAVVLAEPISSHTTLKEQLSMIQQVKPQKVIPVHYSNPAWPGDPAKFKSEVTEAEVIVLADGESVKL